MGGPCCQNEPKFDGADPQFRRALIAVIVINLAMFAVEMTAGYRARSQALQADALDFFADGVTYSISLCMIGMGLRMRSLAAFGKGVSLFLMAAWVFGSTAYEALHPALPEADVMGLIGFMALTANITSVLLLMKWREGDANIRSVWLCSRNDAIGNIVVMLAALGVFGTGTAWPDLLVAAVMAGLFLSSSVQILGQSFREWKRKW